MDSQIIHQATPPQTNNLLNKLRLLSEAAHFFSNAGNRSQLFKDWTFEAVEIYLQETVFNLGLNDSSEEINFESLLTALDEFLLISEENQLESIVPSYLLEEMEKTLEENNIKNEEILENIKKENEERIAFFKRLAENRKRLEKIIENPPVTQEEIARMAPEIIAKIEPEIKSLAEEAKRAQNEEILRENIQKKGQEIYLRVVQENNSLPLEVKEYLLSRQISAETVIQLATFEQIDQKTEILVNSISPLTTAEASILKEEIFPIIAANTVNLSPEASFEEIKEVVAISLIQEPVQKEILSISSDKILNSIDSIALETQKFLTENNQPAIDSSISPAIIYDKNRLIIPLTSPPIPGNPQGEVNKLNDENGNTAKDILKSLRSGNIKEKFSQFSERSSNLSLFKLSIQGISPEELEKIALLNRYKGNLSKASQAQELATRLRAFQEQFFYRSSLPRQWIANKVKNSFTYKTVGAFISKTGVGQAISFGVSKVTQQINQRGLQELWSGFKIGTSKMVTKGIGTILGKLGLAATGPLGAVAGFIAPKLIRGFIGGLGKISNFIFGSFRLFNGFVSGISGDNSEADNTKWLIPLLSITFLLVILILPFIATVSTDTAFVGKGGTTSEGEYVNPGPPTYPDIQCNPSRHLGEEVICQLTQREAPCNQSYVGSSNWLTVNSCFSKPETNFLNKDIIRTSFLTMSSNVNLGYHIHCLGFCLAVKRAMGESFDVGNRGSASDYANPPYPVNYKPVDTPQLGDLVIWGRTPPGHIAIYLGSVENSTSKMVVAEANFDNQGGLAVRARLNESYGAGPDLYLHYQK